MGPNRAQTLRKTTYLCGGINGLSDDDCNNWRRLASSQLITAVLDPMRRDYRGIEEENVEQIVIGDLEDIRKSDFILVNAIRPSWGTAMEIVYSQQMGKRIISFAETSRISPWLEYHCSTVVGSIDEAIHIINQEAA